ncbi:FixH family protein [Uliginosibacterium sp. 31-12]|uniref:FixH family protein n=1 Tax=Uliginosibacterium sp. 31-12 TaxID=3062781 RepID=UPI0026E30ED0|nr:FixH family protein [Uliginosibacterium sp. 31-12]MDO6384711.1 FixH family protein [Uliginosibacterium sp. 31-12]
MNNPAMSLEPRPWYRQLWPWLIISMPLTAVLAGAATWYLAWHSNDGLVADDYYKQGMEINRSLASQETARQLGLSGTLRQRGREVALHLEAEREITFPQRLNLHVVSPVKAGLDQDIELRREGGEYRGVLEGLSAGHWKLILEDQGGTWKLIASGVFPLDSVLDFKP